MDYSGVANSCYTALNTESEEKLMPADEEARLRELMLRLPLAERAPGMEEVERLERLVTAYEAIRPKRRYDPQAEAYQFVPEVLALCRQAGCLNPVIVSRQPIAQSRRLLTLWRAGSKSTDSRASVASCEPRILCRQSSRTGGRLSSQPPPSNGSIRTGVRSIVRDCFIVL